MSTVLQARSPDALCLPGGAQVPPALQSVACRPIMLDTASSLVTYPSIEHRLKKKESKLSFQSVKNLFGGWRS